MLAAFSGWAVAAALMFPSPAQHWAEKRLTGGVCGRGSMGPQQTFSEGRSCVTESLGRGKGGDRLAVGPGTGGELTQATRARSSWYGTVGASLHPALPGPLCPSLPAAQPRGFASDFAGNKEVMDRLSALSHPSLPLPTSPSLRQAERLFSGPASPFHLCSVISLSFYKSCLEQTCPHTVHFKKKKPGGPLLVRRHSSNLEKEMAGHSWLPGESGKNQGL